MQQATMSQFGPLHAGAHIEQAQPALQLKPTDGSLTAALPELD